MSTTPESLRADDHLVNLISRWLAGHLRDDDFRRQIEAAAVDELGPEQAEAVEELLGELDRAAPGARGDVEMVARETLEALALGG